MSEQAEMPLEHVDRFRSPSSAGVAGVFLAASSSAPRAPFFRGYLASPRRGADLMLTLAHVVETRFYRPPGMVERLIRQRDPVITCGGGMLRMEGFSVCCGVYARVDFHGGAFDADRLEPGTANVDFNPPMRAALAQLRDQDRTRFEVSASGFTLMTERSGEAFERQVDLPARWVKGFVEVQAHQARMERRFQISGAMARRFLRDLPNQRTRGPVWLTPLGSSVRLSHTPLAGGVSAGGIERLQVMATVARHATSIDCYSSGDGATAWQLDAPGVRLLLVLSPEAPRGFSGEGQVLHSLAAGSKVTSRLRGLLRWQADLTPAALATELDTGQADVTAALAELATSGLVGYDLAQGAYFHRELPFDPSGVARQQPRLTDARALVADGAVELDDAGGWVRGSAADYRVRRDDAGEWHCTCPWMVRHGGTRGPCKHILALQIATAERQA